MILLANIMSGVAYVLDALLWMVMLLVIIRAVISWFSPDPFNPLVRILNSATDPLLAPIRKRLPALGGLDWSPLVLILVVMFLDIALVQSLADYARALRAGILLGG